MKLEKAYILNKALTCFEQAELFSCNRFEREIISTCGNVNKFSINESSYNTIRVINKGKMGLSSFADYDIDINNLINNVKFNSRWGDVVAYDLKISSNNIVKDLKIYDDDIRDIEPYKLSEYIDKTMRLYKIDYWAYRITIIEDLINIIDTQEAENSYKKTVFNFFLDLNGKKNLYYSCKNDIKTFLKKELEKKEIILPNEIYGSKNSLFALSPKAIYNVFYKSIALNFNGKRECTEGIEKVKFSSKLSIIDDGKIDWMTGSQPFDDEGIECEKKYLVKNGTIVSGYHDKRTSSLLKIDSTGNSKRSWGTPSNPYLNNMIFNIDNVIKFDEFINKIKSGIYIVEIIDVGSDIINWDFNGIITKALKIRNGEFVGILHNIHVKVNLIELLNNIISGADDYTIVAGNTLISSLLFADSFILMESQNI